LAVLLSFVLWHLARTMDIQVGSLEKEEDYKFVKTNSLAGNNNTTCLYLSNLKCNKMPYGLHMNGNVLWLRILSNT